MTLVNITRQLIDIPSLTGNERSVAEFLAAHLEALGYDVERQPVTGDRFNIIATTASAPRIVFSTHMDTVPPFIPSREDAEYIHGRGSGGPQSLFSGPTYGARRLAAKR